jgi:hypothetical protein
MGKYGWALRECALKIQDSETVLRVDWELLNWGRKLYSIFVALRGF